MSSTVEAVDFSVRSVRRSSRRTAYIASLILAGSCAAACQTIGSGNRTIPAGFWFEGLTPAAIAVVNERLITPLTAEELRAIESIARRELQIAFDNTRLHFSESRASVYSVRVVPQLKLPRTLPSAGESLSFGGTRGNGAVNFNTVAISAIAFTTESTDRETVVNAIGRGVGRTAAHEFAHQILGPSDMDGTADLLTYEHADLRHEHFFATLHWGPAAERLRQRVGLRR